MNRLALTLATSLTAAACGAPSDIGDEASSDFASLEQSIVGAEMDSERRAVLAVATVVRRTQGLCTGTLIAPNLVLTAQHCVAPTEELVDCRTAEFEEAYGPENIYVSPDTTLGRAADFYPALELHVPPGNAEVCGRDIALVILDGQFSSAIAPLSPRLDREVSAGELYTAVGFGDALEEGDPGVRRSRDGLAVTCGPSECRGSGALTRTEFVGDESVCEGDSGGPAIDADGRIVGVVSRGADNCGPTIYSAVSPWRDWIAEVTERAIALGRYPAPSWYEALVDELEAPPTGTPVAGGGDPEPAVAAPTLDPVAEPSSSVRASRDSGCSVGAAPSAAGLGGWLLLAVAGIALARRRR